MDKKVKQEVFDLYDQYVHNQLTRRQFVERLSIYAIGGLTVSSLLSFISPDYLDKIQIQDNDDRLNTEIITYASEKGGGSIDGQLSRPKNSAKKLQGIIVVHENRGLNPHISDVGRRAALEGFITLAPDALSPLGGYPGNDEDGRTMQRKRDRNEMLEDFISAYHYLKSHPECDGNIGVVGFCFGGWISNMMAIKLPNLKAAVPFYGGQPPLDEVINIKAALLLQYAGLDDRVNKGWPEYKAALEVNKKDFTAYIYPDVNHGFHNDTTPRYDESAAKLAWKRTIDFFKVNLA